MEHEFPKDFVWGVATAAAQVEGAAYEDGRGPSIWDVYSRQPGKILGGATPEVACDQYHRIEEDVRLMKELGIKSYRFSFSWSRLLPEGTGRVNPEGIAYYHKLIRCLHENHITANATLYHWDLPYALALKGGFGNREIVEWYKEYASLVFDEYGQEVDLWATFNEPISVYVGWSMGMFAPGLKDEKYGRQCLHHLLVCHGEAVRLFRQKKLPGKIGIVVDVWHHYTTDPENPEACRQAQRGNEMEGYGMFLNPIFLGEYTQVLKDYMQETGTAPVILDGDMQTISQPLDFYGLNFYNGLFDGNTQLPSDDQENKGGNIQDRPAAYVQAVYDVLHMLKEKYHVNIPIYITENGYCQEDAPREIVLKDDARIAYCTEVLKWVHKAMQDGIDVRGYYLWSLLDNFEWTAGYTLRYGIFYTDFQTQERIPKKSAAWYKALIEKNGF